MLRHALVRFQGQGFCDPRMWYQICRIPITKPDLLTELRLAIRERILTDAFVAATDERKKLEEKRRSLLSRAGVVFKPRGGFMGLLLGEQHNFTWEEQKADLDKNIREKTDEVDGIEDVYYERQTAKATCVVDSGAVPSVGIGGFMGSIDGVQLNWYGSHKPLLSTNLLLLHEERFGKVMQLLVERNPVPGSDEIFVKYTIPEEKSTKDESYGAIWPS